MSFQVWYYLHRCISKEYNWENFLQPATCNLQPATWAAIWNNSKNLKIKPETIDIENERVKRGFSLLRQVLEVTS